MNAPLLLRSLLLSSLVVCCLSQYAPTWASLDSRPLPPWYDEAKIGIFIHMGVFSVPSFHGEWFWADWLNAKDQDVVDFVSQTEAPNFVYADYASRLTYELFNATDWLALFAASGAKYVVPTSKHHEGYCNWPSATSFNWNSMDVGPRRDLIGELANATRSAGLKVGAYHSLFEWFNPLYLADKASNWTTRSFVTGKTMPELYDLVERYRPELIWSDGDWEASDLDYWRSPDFLAWLVNDSPVKDTVVFNDRWGGASLCHHGSFYTCADRFLPSSLVGHKWENAFTLDTQSWGFRRNAVYTDYMSVAEVIATVVQTTALGGNSLINVGPARDGTIDNIFADRLLGLGAWLKVNGDAIYATQPWSRAQNDTDASVWYTSKGGNVYAIMLTWPQSGRLTLVAPIGVAGSTQIKMIGSNDGACTWEPVGAAGAPGIIVSLIAAAPGTPLATTSAWVLEMQGVM